MRRTNQVRRRRLAVTTVVAALMGMLAAGCSSGSGSTHGTQGASGGSGGPTTTDAPVAGDIPDSQVFVVYTPAGQGFTVKVPQGWARREDGTGVTFSDAYNSIRIETESLLSAPTVASVTSTELSTLAKSATGYKSGTVSTVIRPAGSAVLATYQADSAPNPVTAKTTRVDAERYEFWKAGRAIVLTLSAPVGSDNADPWRTVTDSFGWTA